MPLVLVDDPEYVGRRRPEGWTIRGTGVCRACSARISWAETPTGRTAPLDPDGTSHFATCPDAERFRRSRQSRPMIDPRP